MFVFFLSQWIVFGLILFFFFFPLSPTPLFFTLPTSPFPLLFFFFLLFSMELHKALTLVDPTSNPPVTSTSLTPVHPGQQHPHPAPMAFPLQPLTMKPATAPITYFSGYNPMGLVDPATSAAAAAAAGTMAMERKTLTTKLRVGVTASALKAAERPKFAPY